MLSTELNLISARVEAYEEKAYNDQREIELIATEELGDRALIHAAKYQQDLRHYHDRNVKIR